MGLSITNEFLKVALYGAEWVMYVLIACSILSIAVILERVVFFYKLRGQFPEFLEALSQKLTASAEGEGQESPRGTTAAWCSAQNTLEATVAAVGLNPQCPNLRCAEEQMGATVLAAKSRMEKGLTVLGTLGNNTPFIGLFGTIIGIIQAFNNLATATTSGPEVVMASISEALVATAVGLMVAIPAVIAYNLFTRKIKTLLTQAETTSRVVLGALSRWDGSPTKH